MPVGGKARGCATWGGPEKLQTPLKVCPQRPQWQLPKQTRNFPRVFPASLTLFAHACYLGLLGFGDASVYVKHRRRVVFVFVGVVRFQEGDMQVLGWTLLLLSQWILQKVSCCYEKKQSSRRVLGVWILRAAFVGRHLLHSCLKHKPERNSTCITLGSS